MKKQNKTLGDSWGVVHLHKPFTPGLRRHRHTGLYHREIDVHTASLGIVMLLHVTQAPTGSETIAWATGPLLARNLRSLMLTMYSCGVAESSCITKTIQNRRFTHHYPSRRRLWMELQLPWFLYLLFASMLLRPAFVTRAAPYFTSYGYFTCPPRLHPQYVLKINNALHIMCIVR
jgi:hypothetical protein